MYSKYKQVYFHCDTLLKCFGELSQHFSMSVRIGADLWLGWTVMGVLASREYSIILISNFDLIIS